MRKPADKASPSSAKSAPDPAELAQRLAQLAERGQKLAAAAIERQQQNDGFQIPDPKVVVNAFADWMQKALAEPQKLVDAQTALMRDYLKLWTQTVNRLNGGAPEPPVATPAKDDRRFADPEWNETPWFDLCKQAYLLSARWLQDTVRQVDGLDPDTKRKVDFYTRQYVDAMAPTNFIATNPKVLRETVQSGGKNLVAGLEHLMDDLERGKGHLAIKMTDLDAFRLGENVAASPGKVVFQNDLMQLIQYAPTTATVARRPLLLIPPWINKFYILDLKPTNSFIKWAVDSGLTVFVISWVNPDRHLAHKTFDDYMLEGPFAALDAIEQATGEKSANVIGYCIGGTLLAGMLAYMAAKRDARIKSATFFTAMIDFKEAGELKVFIDEEQLAALEKHLQEKGYLEARHMSQVFNLMRDNDLIWSFVVNNYLLGKEPFPFDLLYWNSDATRMPATMHTFYLRNMYMENRLIEPGGISLCGTKIDLRKVKLPVYQLSTESDHIAPWRSTYTASQLFKGPYKFVLSGSGHIAGVVNPPAAKKYCYWTNPENPPTPAEWLNAATRHDGSWWPDWRAWLEPFCDDQVPARVPGDGRLTPIEDAPGSYVRVKAEE